MAGKIWLLIVGFIVVPLMSVASVADAQKKITRESIMEGAKREGRVSWATNLVDAEVRDLNRAFQKEFPFIRVEYGRVRGTEESERVMSEMQAGIFPYDMIHVQNELVSRYMQLGFLLEPVDWIGLFGVEPAIIHPQRFAVAIGTTPAGITYNKHRVPKERIPKRWDDCLDPFFKGRHALEVHPRHLLSVMVGYGEKWTLEFAKKIAANKPRWTSGTTAADTLVAAGEVLIQCPASYASWYRQAIRKPGFPVDFVFPEGPVVATPSLLLSPLKGSPNFNAAILLTGWLATKGISIIDTGRESILHPETRLGKEFKQMGREVKVASWEFVAEADKNASKILEVVGFPRPER